MRSTRTVTVVIGAFEKIVHAVPKMFTSDWFLSLGYELTTTRGVAVTSVDASSPNMEFGQIFFMPQFQLTFLCPKLIYEPFHTNTFPKYTFRARTIMSNLKNKMLHPESNTGAANYALAVLDQLNYVTCFFD